MSTIIGLVSTFRLPLQLPLQEARGSPKRKSVHQSGRPDITFVQKFI